MKEVIDSLEIGEFDSASDIVENHGEKILSALGSDEVIPQHEDTYKSVTYDDIAKDLVKRLCAEENVRFKSADSGSGRPEESREVTTVEEDEYNPLVKYNVTCSGCYSSGTVDVRHGYNNYFECSNCGSTFCMG